MNRAKALQVDRAFGDLEANLAVTGKLPDDFAAPLRGHLAAIKAEPHLGTWQDPAKQDGSTFDFSALAAWLNREDPVYNREHIAARRKGGPSGWLKWSKPIHRWLAFEDVALARLAMQLLRRGEELTPTEGARLRLFAMSPLGLYRKYGCEGGESIVKAAGGNSWCEDIFVIDHSTNTTSTQHRALLFCPAAIDNELAGK